MLTLETIEHRKTRMLATLMRSEQAAITTVAVLFAAAEEYFIEGVIDNPLLLAGHSRWHGDPSDLIEMLVQAGLLERDEQYGLVIHDWPAKCSPSVKRKLRSTGKEFCPVYGAELLNGRKPVEKPEPDKPDLPEDPVVRVIKAKGGDVELRKSTVDEWQRVYAAVDVLHVVDRAVLWLDSNPGRGPFAKNIGNWLLSQWIQREQSKGRSSASFIGDKLQKASVGAASKPAQPLFEGAGR